MIVTAQRVCGAAVALFFLCFLLSGSGGGLSPSSDAAPGKRRLISRGSEPNGSWQDFGSQQRPVPPVKTLSWEEARVWVRQGLEALAVADGAQGWRVMADPLAALRDEAPADRADSSRRRRQLLSSSRTAGHGWPLRWRGRRTARKRQLGEDAMRGVVAASQGVDPDSLDVPADDADEGDEEGAADGRPRARAPTALVVVPTANVWNMTAAMISTLEMCRDRFELLVRIRIQVLCSAAVLTLTWSSACPRCGSGPGEAP